MSETTHNCLLTKDLREFAATLGNEKDCPVGSCAVKITVKTVNCVDVDQGESCPVTSLQ